MSIYRVTEEKDGTLKVVDYFSGRKIKDVEAEMILVQLENHDLVKTEGSRDESGNGFG